MSARPPPRAAALVIGNEILSGKIQEANVVILARVLREAGVELVRVVVIADDETLITEEIRTLAARFDWLFTSGGIGPTHDDVTVTAAARAFDVDTEQHPELEAMLRTHYGEACTNDHLRMALVPCGASLETTESMRWPTIRYQNTWLLPGIPEVFRMKMEVVRAKIGQSPRFVSLAVYTNLDEGSLRPLLDGVVGRHGSVSIGSYPKWSSPLYKTKITFDGLDANAVESARADFLAHLPPGGLAEVGDELGEGDT